VGGFQGRELLFQGGAHYPGLETDLSEGNTMVKRDSDQLRPEGEGADREPVRGPTQGRPALGAALFAITVNRCLPTEEGTIGLPIRTAELAQLLEQTYSRVPDVIAETMLLLRRCRAPQLRWLLRVLNSRPELRSLAGAVQQAFRTKPVPRVV
jgi:hypothetical protein